MLDFLHVAEYVWKAGMALNGEGNPKLDAWLSAHLLGILCGRSGHVAAGIRRSATLRELDPRAREAVDRCADYLLNHTRSRCCPPSRFCGPTIAVPAAKVGWSRRIKGSTLWGRRSARVCGA